MDTWPIGTLPGHFERLASCRGWTYLAQMKTGYTAIIKEDGGWWVGWVEEIPGVNGQERTKDELLISLREALLDILELNRRDAREIAIRDYEEVPLDA